MVPIEHLDVEKKKGNSEEKENKSEIVRAIGAFYLSVSTDSLEISMKCAAVLWFIFKVFFRNFSPESTINKNCVNSGQISG